MQPPLPPPGQEILRWAEPLISDIVHASYGDLDQELRETQFLIRCQCMLWRAVLGGIGTVDAFQKEILRSADRLCIGESRIEDVNRQILTELMLVIASRHARSPRQAAELSVQVAQAYRQLSELRQGQQA